MVDLDQIQFRGYLNHRLNRENVRAPYKYLVKHE